MQFELLPVACWPQVDQPQLVVRQGQQGVALLEGERWIAPLANEVRDALSADLARALDSRDISGLAGIDKPSVRIKLDLRRFDSQLGRNALVEGAWSVRLVHGARAASISCTSRVSESVGAGYPALVQGHQRAISATGDANRCRCPFPGQRADAGVPGRLRPCSLAAGLHWASLPSSPQPASVGAHPIVLTAPNHAGHPRPELT